jgi:SAM-dependent methyltransferase
MVDAKKPVKEPIFSSKEEKELFDYSLPRYFHLQKEIRRLYPVGPKQPRLLDLGVGGGSFLYLLRAAGYQELFGLDKPYDLNVSPVAAVSATENFTEILKKRSQTYGFTVALADFARERLPYESGSFDLVVMTEVLEHLYTGVLHTFGEIYRVLKPGGYLLLTTPNVRSLKNLSLFFTANIFENLRKYTELPLGYFHFRLYTLQEVEYLCEKVGLICEVKKCLNFHRTPFPGHSSFPTRLFLTLNYYFGKYLYGGFNQYLYVRAKKK